MLEFKLTLPLLSILYLHTPMVPVECVCSKIAFSKVQDSDDYNHGEDVNGG